MPDSSLASCDQTSMLIGTSLASSSRRVAVTLTSSRPVIGVPEWVSTLRASGTLAAAQYRPKLRVWHRMRTVLSFRNSNCRSVPSSMRDRASPGGKPVGTAVDWRCPTTPDT